MHRRTALLLVALCVVLAPALAGADAEGATIDKTGWWNRANTTVATPAAPVTVPPPPGVPEGDLVVGYAGGDEPAAILAVGIQPDAEPGATVERFTLRLTEDPAAGGNVNTAGAAIVACPITDFWAGGENGDWATRPGFDCGAAAVEGRRSGDGTWTFDLAPIGALWFDPFGTIRADGVAVTPVLDVAQPPFQAVFRGGDAIAVDLVAVPGAGGGDPGFDGGDPTGGAPGDVGMGGSTDLGSGGSVDFGSGGSTDFDVPDGGSFEPPALEPAPVPEGSTAGDDVAAPPAPAGPATELAADRAGEVFGNLPPLVVPGAVLLLALLLTTSYWLGPNGEPVTAVRQRGVSRALDVRARAEKGT